MTERPLDAAERPDAPEFLEVEPGRAMHTGGFHDFLLRGWKAVSPGHELYVGITTRSHPETNTAIYEYANGVPAQHRRTRYEGTAVYKKGFLGRLGLNEADVLDGSCHRVPASAARDATGRIPVRLFGDEGIAVKAEDIFNLNEIEAIICWGVSREQTAAEYDAALRARGAAIPLYIQEENPAFAAEFDARFGVVGCDVPPSPLAWPATFDEFRDVRQQLVALLDDPRGNEHVRSGGYDIYWQIDRIRAEIAALDDTGKIIISRWHVLQAQKVLAEEAIERDIPRWRYRLCVPGKEDEA